MGEMDAYAPKDGMNTFHKYEYTSISQYVAHVRPALVEQGLFIIPRLLKRTDYDDHTTDVLMEYTIVDSESGEYISTQLEGRGQDSTKDGKRLDKGPYKAYSGAFKYFLSEMFMIASGDDPDDGENSGKQGQSRQPVAKRLAGPKPQQTNGKGKAPTNAKELLELINRRVESTYDNEFHMLAAIKKELGVEEWSWPAPGNIDAWKEAYRLAKAHADAKSQTADMFDDQPDIDEALGRTTSYAKGA